MVLTAIGSFSLPATSASAGDCDGLRIVACTRYFARPNAIAVSNPIPLLVPVIRTDCILILPPPNQAVSVRGLYAPVRRLYRVFRPRRLRTPKYSVKQKTKCERRLWETALIA